MSNNELPNGWINSTLGEIANVKSGIGFPPRYQGKIDGQYPVYKVGDVSRSVLNDKGMLKIAKNYVNSAEVKELKGYVFPKGTVLFAKIGEAVRLNRRAFVIKEGLADNNIMGVTSIISAMNTFIYYYMMIVNLDETSRSTTVPSIRKGDVENLIIPIPPLAEQKEIAARLDDLLAQVDTLKTRLDAIPNILKRFRQSVLGAAVSGKLTEEWRTNSNFIWKQVSLADVALGFSYGTSSKSSKEGRIPVLRMGNIQGGNLIWDDLVYTSDEDEIKKYNLLKGDVLFNRTNSPELVGKTAIYRGEYPAIYAGYLICVRCKSALDPEFLNISLNSLDAKAYCRSVKSDGVSQSNINAKKLAAYSFYLPPIEEQTEIVRRVEELFAFADQVEQQVKAAQQRVNHLTQAILAKAFRGELTAQWREQNPDLISGENSAAALLARIKAEKKK